MKTIEATVQIDLSNSKQITAYYQLLMSIGGHELIAPSVEVRNLSLVSSLQGKTAGEGLPSQRIDLSEVDEKKKQSRKKKAPAEETTAEETTAEETTAEETTAEETTAEETTAEETTGNDLPLDFFRKKVADLNAEHGTAKVQELKVWLSEKFGTFKADQLTGHQRAEAFDYMKLTYKIK